MVVLSSTPQRLDFSKTLKAGCLDLIIPAQQNSKDDMLGSIIFAQQAPCTFSCMVMGRNG